MDAESNEPRRSSRKRVERKKSDEEALENALREVSSDSEERTLMEDTCLRLMKWVSNGELPVLFVEVTEEMNQRMLSHAKQYRDPVPDSANNKRRLVYPPQPHPLVFSFATSISLDTSDINMVIAVLRFHLVPLPPRVKPFVKADYVFALNEALERYITHTNTQWREEGDVWPARLKELSRIQRQGINEFRTCVLGALREKLRTFLTLTHNIARGIPERGEFMVTCPLSIFTHLVGSSRMENLGICEMNGKFIKVLHEEAASMDYLFPATSQDMESDKEEDTCFGHPLCKRWHRQYITEETMSTRFEYYNLQVTYNLGTATMGIRGYIRVHTKRKVNGKDCLWVESADGRLVEQLLAAGAVARASQDAGRCSGAGAGAL